MRLAVISGASSGVGRASAELFVRNGFKVVMLARSADKLARIAKALGENAVAIPCDLADAKAVEDVAATVMKEHGVPDVLINSAGAGQWKRIEDTSGHEVVEMLNAPYMAAFNLTRVFVKDMIARGSGVILHVNSPASMVVWPNAAGYTAARWALRGLHEALLQDLYGTGVKSCHVIFSRVDSEYFDNNPGVLDHMPVADKLVPSLTPEVCARHLLHLSDNPRKSAVYPALLRVVLPLHRIWPSLFRWVLRR